jgi:hypothetical protein
VTDDSLDDQGDAGLMGLGSGRQDLIVLHDGRTMTTHGPGICFAGNCCIHSPSDHPLRDAPLSWSDEMKLMFRVCEHDQIHPDPDSLFFNQWVLRMFYDGWHPCCDARCCYKKEEADDRDG